MLAGTIFARWVDIIATILFINLIITAFLIIFRGVKKKLEERNSKGTV